MTADDNTLFSHVGITHESGHKAIIMVKSIYGAGQKVTVMGSTISHRADNFSNLIRM